jgi:hypothetical protein
MERARYLEWKGALQAHVLGAIFGSAQLTGNQLRKRKAESENEDSRPKGQAGRRAEFC